MNPRARVGDLVWVEFDGESALGLVVALRGNAHGEHVTIHNIVSATTGEVPADIISYVWAPVLSGSDR